MDARVPSPVDAQKMPRKEVADKRVAGLRLRIGRRVSSWIVVARVGKFTSRHVLGHAPPMTRAEARQAALTFKLALLEGRDPRVRPLRNGQSFGATLETYFGDCERRTATGA